MPTLLLPAFLLLLPRLLLLLLLLPLLFPLSAEASLLVKWDDRPPNTRLLVHERAVPVHAQV